MLPEHDCLFDEFPFPELDIIEIETPNAESNQEQTQVEEEQVQVKIHVVEPAIVVEEAPQKNAEMPQLSVATTRVIPLPPTFAAPVIRPMKEQIHADQFQASASSSASVKFNI